MQSLCTECGLCCDGTLFRYVPLLERDELARIRPADMIVLDDGQSGLRQSCPFFRNHLCTIYTDGRPQSCAEYRCHLLDRYVRGEISRADALAEIRATVEWVRSLQARLQTASGATARNLTDAFEAWLVAQGGCIGAWTEEQEATVHAYHDLLSHLKRVFGLGRPTA